MTAPGTVHAQTPIAGLVDLALTAPTLRDLTERAADGPATLDLVGPPAARVFVTAALARGGPLLVVTATGRHADDLTAELRAVHGDAVALFGSGNDAVVAREIAALAPGVVDTPMWDVVDAQFAKYEGRPLGEKKRLVGEGVPYGRMGKPGDHVGCAVFLACGDSDYVVAQTFNVDGGQWMS